MGHTHHFRCCSLRPVSLSQQSQNYHHLLSLSSSLLSSPSPLSASSSLSSSSSSSSSNSKKKKRNKNNNSNKNNNNKNSNESSSILQRADRVLSSRTSYSRSEANTLLRNNRVSMIVVVHDENENENDNDPSKKKMVRIKGPKIKISMNTELYVHDKKKSGSKSNISDESGRNGDGTVVPLLPPVLILFHKPKNVLSKVPPFSLSSSSPFDLNVISSLYHQVGRLDYDSSGLILFSRNGDLTNHLLHPSKG